MNHRTVYQPRYSGSRALVVGVNTYKKWSPLSYAKNDAEAMASLLGDTLGFDRVKVLLDGKATKARILQAFYEFCTDPGVDPDNRIVVFFAGHGHTLQGNRGDVGYLVPADAAASDPSTLIPWTELTRGADVIRAKHILFIMDACFSGLAIKRALAPGSMRFVGDMLQRYARQVLAAGKGNQIVDDANGPRPGHSIFTGHLLEAIESDAVSTDGVVTANAVMAHV